ncbi:heme utilization cystosolic carrier protein HutX [Photobacterium atrarenae]|uniref:Heme utilization cystosolic carrier protein HutX n=2 Tax=Photobacterium atrarenae TaxID=865757 RepID=A0ABY5GIY4_9GAMM|nr:heme utilization cystosolic carrier protein HutX [Photobacterium atrarenae]UTV28893.1 heme utilization cystosolic carrier protein HutX [Photobacterium atrarenae]
MFEKIALESLKIKVAEMLAENPALHAVLIAQELDITEGEVIMAFPSEWVETLPGEHAQAVLETLPSWGPMTTIVHSMGSIFEIKAPFPKGKEARGYYNLMGKEGELHGHLRLDRVAQVVLVSKPSNGNATYFIGFLADNGECIFKVYLGRDKQRQLFPEQIEQFKQLKQQILGE